MKVKDLIKVLKTAQQDVDIVISVDEEGNDFKPIDAIEVDERPVCSHPKAKKIVDRYIIFPIG